MLCFILVLWSACWCVFLVCVPYLSLFDFYVFWTLHLVMKGKRYADIKDIQRLTTAILIVISTNQVNMSFSSLLDTAKWCIKSKGGYFE